MPLQHNGINLSDVRQGFRGMIKASRGSGAREFFRAMAKPAKQDVREHQKDKRAESGSWPALDPDTLARRRRNRARPIGRRVRRARRVNRRATMLGRLPKAWQVKVEPDRLLLTSPIAWSGVHDAGGTAGNGARIPRRQFAYLSRELLDEAQAIYSKHILTGWNRG